MAIMCLITRKFFFFFFIFPPSIQKNAEKSYQKKKNLNIYVYLVKSIQKNGLLNYSVKVKNSFFIVDTVEIWCHDLYNEIRDKNMIYMGKNMAFNWGSFSIPQIDINYFTIFHFVTKPIVLKKSSDFSFRLLFSTLWMNYVDTTCFILLFLLLLPKKKMNKSTSLMGCV